VGNGWELGADNLEEEALGSAYLRSQVTADKCANSMTEQQAWSDSIVQDEV
jgi:hypothetical protein